MVIMVDVLKNYCVTSITFTFLPECFMSSPTPSSIFYNFQKDCFNNYVFDVRHKYRSDGVGVWLSPLPTSYRRILVTERTRVVILSACATVRDGYVLCVCVCVFGGLKFSMWITQPYISILTLTPWTRVVVRESEMPLPHTTLGSLMAGEREWEILPSLHPPFKTRLIEREGRFRFSANIRAAGVAVHIG